MFQSPDLHQTWDSLHIPDIWLKPALQKQTSHHLNPKEDKRTRSARHMNRRRAAKASHTEPPRSTAQAARKPSRIYAFSSSLLKIGQTRKKPRERERRGLPQTEAMSANRRRSRRWLEEQTQRLKFWERTLKNKANLLSRTSRSSYLLHHNLQ